MHLYPRDHYAPWRRELPQISERFSAGAFGENLVVGGITESDVCIGDVFWMGKALIALSQGRQPCWRLNLRFGIADMVGRVQASGRTGWYFRVVERGDVEAGATLALLERPNPDWSLTRVHHLLYRDPLNRDALAEFSALAGLSPSWRDLARRRLERRSVESWDARVNSPD